MRYKTFVRFGIYLLLLVVIYGCGEDFPIFTETLEVDELKAGQPSIGAGETTTIVAPVSYSGDETVLMYKWAADAGTIQGTGNRASYIAPSSPGTYSISVTVTDGVISSGKTIDIVVTQKSVESLILDQNTHWPASAHQDKLAYDVRITSLVGGRVLLHYDITQDKDKFDVFLSIQIGQKVVLQEMAIGGEQPSTAVRTVRDLDVTNVITGPGRYLITFYVRPGDRAKNGWLLNEAKLIGVKGTSDPQQ